ncbi:MAG: universal stress protein [Methanomassiliicoccales archaeon]
MEITDILVGVDGSDNSLRAAEFAAEMASRFNVKVTLLLAYSPSDSAIFAGKDTYIPEDEALQDRRMRRGKKVLEEKGITHDTRVELDHPANAIIKAAEEGYSHVVVGCRGLSGFKGMLMGSVSTKVVHHCKLPVTVVP